MSREDKKKLIQRRLTHAFRLCVPFYLSRMNRGHVVAAERGRDVLVEFDHGFLGGRPDDAFFVSEHVMKFE